MTPTKGTYDEGRHRRRHRPRSAVAIVVVVLLMLAGACSTSAASNQEGTTMDTAATNPEPTLSDAQLTAIADDARSACKADGAVVGIDVPGEERQIRASGQFAPGIPIAPDSQYFAGSVTKLLVATVVLQLVEQGRLSLQDHVDRFLDWPRGDELTIDMLLSHRSGLGDFGNNFGADLTALVLADLNRKFSYPEVLAMVAGVPRIGEPGGDYHYSNANYIVLGAIIERITGLTLGNAMNTRIIEPLGLTNTFYGPDDLSALAATTFHGLFDIAGNGTPIDIGSFPRTAAFTVDPAGSGLVTNADDTLTLLDALFGGDQLLTEASRDYLAAQVSTLHTPDVLLDAPFQIVGHGGASPGAQVIAAHDQRTGVSTVAWCNRLDPGEHELLATIIATHALFDALP